MAKYVSVGKTLDLYQAFRSSHEAAGEPISIGVLIDAHVPQEMRETIKQALLPERTAAQVFVRQASTGAVLQLSGCTALICVGDEPTTHEAAAYAAEKNVPVFHIGEVLQDSPALMSCSYDEALIELASWFASDFDERISLAAVFPFCRTAVQNHLIQKTALANAAVGAVALVPNSDFLIMTTAQLKLAFDLAATYGQGASARLALQLGATVAAGVVYRNVARKLVSPLPIGASVVKSLIGFFGTWASAELIRMMFTIDEVDLRTLIRTSLPGKN